MRTIDYTKLNEAVESMDQNGINVDIKAVNQLEDKYHTLLEYGENRLSEIAANYHMAVAVNSPNQVATLIYLEMGFKPSMKRKGKDLVPDYSTGARTLEYVRKINKDKNPEVLDLIAQIRSYQKLINWTQALKQSLINGKLYCIHHIDGAVSGRFTCTGAKGKVNFHAVPREFRNVFMA